tara:strand:- start:274 stop:1086 length:813 start_codon:yes stop_codon:yes gene_type:complete
MRCNVCLFLFLLHFATSCKEDGQSVQNKGVPPPETVPKSDYDSLLSKQLAERADFNQGLAANRSEMFANIKERDAVIEDLRADIDQKQAAITALEEALDDVNAKLKDCHEVGVALRAELKGAKSLGALEYADLFDRSSNISHEEAIRLYELFLDKFPSGSVSRKAQSRINFHKQQVVVKKNRASARPLRIWQSRFQANRLSSTANARTALETLIGRKADSAKRGSSSEFKEVTYVWRDYISDFSSGFRDLIVETIDDKIAKVYAGETVRK